MRLTSGIATDASISVEGFQSDDSSSTVVLSDGEDFRKHAGTETAAEQPRSQGCETEAQREEQQVLTNPTCAKDRAALLSQQQTGQLVKEVRFYLQQNCCKLKILYKVQWEKQNMDYLVFIEG